MDMIEAYKKALRHYADFSGRATRSEFWLYSLMVVLVNIAACIIDASLGIVLLSPLSMLFHLVPNLSTAARRLHDIGKSGWWQLLLFIPIIGAIILLVFLCTRTGPGNQYGPAHT